MDYTKGILVALSERRSIRTFAGSALDAGQRMALQRFIDEARLSQPFGPAQFAINIVDVDTDGDFRPGTYGIIKGARTYLTMTVGATRADAMTAGFVMEQVVLQAWMEGLGTCWIGGTFKESTFLGSTAVPEEQTLRIVVPVGVSADHSRFVDRMARLIAGSNRRKPFGKMFFYGDWHNPLDVNSTYGEALMAMRCAPSSTNSQPWRVLVVGDTVHFYGVRGRFSDIDMGIGLCHFYIYECAAGSQVVFFDDKTHPAAPDKNVEYICSYRRNPDRW